MNNIPDVITYSGVTFLRYKEQYQVRKGKIGTIIYYTRQDDGESGMSVQSLSNACDVAHKALRYFLANTTIFVEGGNKQGQNTIINLIFKENKGGNKPEDFYLAITDEAHIIRDRYCERIISYYAYESRYKKTKAREFHQALAQNGLRSFIHTKTGYESTQAPNHDNSLILSIEELLTAI